MQRTNMVLLAPTRMQEPQLRSLAEASAKLWNMANYQRRQAYFKHCKIPSYSKQCREFKHTKPFKELGTCKAQATLKKLHESWASCLALKRLHRHGRLPSNIRKVCLPGGVSNLEMFRVNFRFCGCVFLIGLGLG